jgi:post-segregation antitoxin (ccd killing protein)
MLHELARLTVGCITRRMPRMQLYLPDDLYEAVKARGLPASELLQKAVRAELRRLDLLEESARYLAELEREVGEPTPAERARAKAAVDRITKRARRKAG